MHRSEIVLDDIRTVSDRARKYHKQNTKRSRLGSDRICAEDGISVEPQQQLQVPSVPVYSALTAPDFPSLMPPLTRPQSRTSIFSWWSDSNPGLRGPTINLHAVAKPLLKLMYHRQALGFIEKNRGVPLSSELITSYLPYSAFILFRTALSNPADGVAYPPPQNPPISTNCGGWPRSRTTHV
ncbi:hypothetical protein B0H11DRAFT_1199447 [Mycena galericulata]|nr:hypothetical protein B0H11DRAFT_1199447 [Mycena galericulata]